MQGKSYFVHVRAMNECGWSDYYLWNDTRAVTYIQYIYTYIHVLYILACIISCIKMMKEKLLSFFELLFDVYVCICLCMYVCVDSESYNKTAAPEKPRNPLAVSGTWHSIDLEVTVPYNNGSAVYVCMYVCMYPSAYV
jgi:hypothetical protein